MRAKSSQSDTWKVGLEIEILLVEISRNLISQPYYFYTTLSYQEAANSMNSLGKVVV
jgi:hypothetical protein